MMARIQANGITKTASVMLVRHRGRIAKDAKIISV
jgi:hypothetical protein